MWRPNWREPLGSEEPKSKGIVRKFRPAKANSPPVGDIIETIPENIFVGNDKDEENEPKITDVKLVASYNWLTSWSPKIIIPGRLHCKQFSVLPSVTLD